MFHLGVGVRRAGAILALSSPLLVFFILEARPELNPQLVVPLEHFSIVSLTAAVGFVLAAVLTVAAVRLDEWRAFLFALAFLAISGLFTIHGLATPGVLIAGNNLAVGLSTSLSLLSGSVFLAASSFDWSPSDRGWQHRAQWLLMIALIGLIALFAALTMRPAGATLPTPARTSAVASGAGGSSADYGEYGAAIVDSRQETAASGGWMALLMGNQLVEVAAAATTLALLGIAAGRHYRQYLAAPLPAQRAVVVGVLLLAQAQVSMVLGEVWHLSWWLSRSIS